MRAFHLGTILALATLSSSQGPAYQRPHDVLRVHVPRPPRYEFVMDPDERDRRRRAMDPDERKRRRGWL